MTLQANARLVLLSTCLPQQVDEGHEEKKRNSGGGQLLEKQKCNDGRDASAEEIQERRKV
jgi:hypothetical protein